MEYFSFLNRIIDDGIEAVKKDYAITKIMAAPMDVSRLEGSIAGFEACRGKKPSELIEVYSTAQEYANKSFVAHDDIAQYWWFRCYVVEVEFVLNVVSAVLLNEGKEPLLNWLPTARGMMRATAILNS